MAYRGVVFDLDTPPADEADRAIWEAHHALAPIIESAVEEFGWGAVAQALLLRYTQEIEAQQQVPAAIDQLQRVLDTWRAGERMHYREGEASRA